MLLSSAAPTVPRSLDRLADDEEEAAVEAQLGVVQRGGSRQCIFSGSLSSESVCLPLFFRLGRGPPRW